MVTASEAKREIRIGHPERSEGGNPKLKFQPSLFSKQLDGDDDQAKNEYQQADAIDAMHITDPFAFRPAGILLFKIKVFGYLTPDSHDVYCHTKLKQDDKL
jgi:hypothetical protein